MNKYKNNILDTVNGLGLIHFVMVSKVYLRSNKSYSDVVYSVFILKKDKPLSLSLKHEVFKEDGIELLCYDLSKEEIARFKTMTTKGKYIKVESGVDGRVYELKNNSFRKYFKKNARGVCNSDES